MSALSVLARSYHNNHQSIPQDNGWGPHPRGSRIPFLNSSGNLVDPQRQLIHPKFRATRDQGLFFYDFNPDITRNFIFAPATKVDGSMTKTIDSNVFIQTPQVEEDVVVTEIWNGGDTRLSTLASMFRVFHDFWTTLPDPGTSISWVPADITSDRFDVQIVKVQLGGADFEYREIREDISDSATAFVNRQLTLQLKIVKASPVPKNSVTLEGL